MGLEAIKGIGPATVKKLNKAGIRTLDDLRGMDITKIAERTGIAENRLGAWKKEAKGVKVLDDVKGIGPAIKKKLHSAGIHTLDDLARAAVHEVAEKTQLAEDRIKAWKKEADGFTRKASAELKPRAQAAAARGRQVAQDASTRGRTLAREATTRARTMATDAQGRVQEYARQHSGEATATATPATTTSAATAKTNTSDDGPAGTGTNGTHARDTSSTATGGKNQGGLLGMLKSIFGGRRD